MILEKPRVSIAEFLWLCAFEEVISKGVGGKVSAHGNDYRIVTWNLDPEMAWVQLRDKEGRSRMVRRGDAMMIELAG